MSNNREIISYVAIIIIGIILAQHMNVVVSGSMEPVFYRGDVVVIEKTDFLGIHEINTDDLKIGDIVIYHAIWFPDPVIHRIIANGTAKMEPHIILLREIIILCKTLIQCIMIKSLPKL